MSSPQPCPYCGDQPDVIFTGSKHKVSSGCGATGPSASNAAHAVTAWNLVARLANGAEDAR